jgi:hypothetical protein
MPSPDFSSQSRVNLPVAAEPAKSMSNEVKTRLYVYQGPLGKVVRCGGCFFASKNGSPVGTYNTFEEAMNSFSEETD